MGIDFLDLRFRCEKEFGIKLDQNDIEGMIQHHPYGSFWAGSGTLDFRVRDFVAVIEQSIQSQHASRGGNVFERLKPIISTTLSVNESEITLDSWLCGDLGME